MIDSDKPAWKVTVNGVDCIVFASGPGKAKWMAVKSWRDSGYGKRGEWPLLSIARAPEFDRSEPTGGLQNSSGCYSPSYLEHP